MSVAVLFGLELCKKPLEHSGSIKSLKELFVYVAVKTVGERNCDHKLLLCDAIPQKVLFGVTKCKKKHTANVERNAAAAETITADVVVKHFYKKLKMQDEQNASDGARRRNGDGREKEKNDQD